MARWQREKVQGNGLKLEIVFNVNKIQIVGKQNINSKIKII